MRTRGLREEALAAASRCADELQASDDCTRSQFTEWVCSHVLAEGVVRSMVLPHPIEQVVLRELWVGHAKDDARSTSWLVRWFPVEVMASQDYVPDSLGEFLRNAYLRDPSSHELRELLAAHLVRWVSADVADLAHGRYDGEPEMDLLRLDEAEALVNDRDPIMNEILDLRMIVTAYLHRRGAGEA
ncbi:MAG: hypothetical protein ACKOW5_06930 [Actinomycetales bacterium]